MHYPSEMPYQCESCGYRTSSHKDVIDHYYKVHEKGEGLQCPYCLKVRKEKYYVCILLIPVSMLINAILLLSKGNAICERW